MRDRLPVSIIGLIALLLLATACRQTPPAPLPTLAATPAAPSPTPAAFTPVLRPTTVGPGGKALVRLVHAAPTAPEVNVYDGVLALATNLGFGQSTEPTALDAGGHALRFTRLGAQSGDLALLESGVTIQPGQNLTIILAIGENGRDFKLLSLPETISPLNARESIINVIHAVPALAEISVRAQGKDITKPTSFGQVTTSSILSSAVIDLEFTSGGSTRLKYPLDLRERLNYTLILTGSAEQLQVVTFSATAPERVAVRLINASAGNLDVDVYLDDKPLAQAVNFGRASARQNIIANEYTVRVYAAGADRATARPIITQAASLNGGASIALILVGSAGQPLLVTYPEDLSPTPPDMARMAFLNAIEAAPALRVQTRIGPVTGIPDLAYGDPPSQTTLPAGQVDLYAAVTNDSEAGEVAEGIKLEAGFSYLYLITGRTDRNPTILSDSVGTAEGGIVQDGTTRPTANVARVHFINAIKDSPAVDFLADDRVAAQGVAVGAGSELIPVALDTILLQARLAGTSDIRGSINSQLQRGERYTVVAYGADPYNIKLVLLSDSKLVFDGGAPYVRLINISQDNDALLGIAFSPSTDAPTPGATANPKRDTPRRSIPLGVKKLVGSIQPGQASSAILMPVGAYNLAVTDGAQTQLAAMVYSVKLEAGVHHDVIAYQEAGGLRVTAFAVRYPA